MATTTSIVLLLMVNALTAGVNVQYRWSHSKQPLQGRLTEGTAAYPAEMHYTADTSEQPAGCLWPKMCALS